MVSIYPDKLNLYINEFGKGDTVIVLHGGFGAEHNYLTDAVKPLQDKFHFIMFDQRGSLRSRLLTPYSCFKKMLADIESIRLALNIKKVTLLAHVANGWATVARDERKPLSMISARSNENSMVLGQVKANDRSKKSA